MKINTTSISKSTFSALQINYSLLLECSSQFCESGITQRNITKMQNAKRKTLTTSYLEQIPGIGKAKAKAILSFFGGKSAIEEATKKQLQSVKGIGEKDAEAIYSHFHKEETT